jgi:hypothetical protein
MTIDKFMEQMMANQGAHSGIGRVAHVRGVGEGFCDI